MTHEEQHTLIVELKDHMKKMKRYDQEEFEMFLKRDTDDEDLDTMSQKRLIRLYEQYIGPLEEGA
jgi:galactose-1-phosphate uridylyltransferase